MGASLMLRSILVLLFVVIKEANGQLGESCGITPTDILDPDYVGEARVGGLPGCTIGNATDCYCSHVIDGEVDNNDWRWHCGDDVESPLANKTCPDTLPEGECDPLTQPSGLPGDPGCGYSDCGGDSTYSAFCGCVDLSSFGAGEGFFWTCLTSTCDCPDQPTQTPTTSGSVVKEASVISVGISAIALLVGYKMEAS